MCGIVAIISKFPSSGFTQNEIDAFHQLLLIDSLRGKDSTGVFGVDDDGNVQIAKAAQHSAQFLEEDAFQSISRRMYRSGFALVGHNRAATRGAVNDENAHPFWVEDQVVLVHNGTFHTDHKKLANVDVDSHAMAHVIQQHDPDAVDEAFAKINAAYATIWYDVRDKSLNILRNGLRPLHFVDTGRSWIVASEREMLDFVIKRNKLGMANHEMVVNMLKEHIHMKVQFDQGRVTVQHSTVNGFSYTKAPTSVITHITPSIKDNPLNATACAWSNMNDDLDTGEVTTLPLIQHNHPMLPNQVAPVVTEQTATGPRLCSEVADKIISDMEHNFFRVITHDKWGQLREIYPTQTSCYFRARNVVPYGDKYVVYGPLTVNDDLIGWTLIDNEDDFVKLIDINSKHPSELHGKVHLPYYKNISDKALEGYGFIQVVNPEKAGEIIDAYSC